MSCITGGQSAVKPRSRTVRVTRPYSPDIRWAAKPRKKKVARTAANSCKNCGSPVRGALNLLCKPCLHASLDVGYKEKQSTQAHEEDKKRYLEEARSFASSLAKVYNDPSAERLFCPDYRPVRGPCACMQKYLVGNGEGRDLRVQSLLPLLHEAQKLCKQKCYDWNEVKRVNGVQTVGLGNGQKHSEQFEQFVAQHRPRLRELRLCERATQRVLFYSNNFLHRCLKTEPNKGRRVQRVKGKAALGRLKTLEEMASETCCQQRCAALARRYATLVEQWRERSQMGQTENRRVLAEMLTPSGPNSTNCYKFISWVTGCSFTTIARVSKQMLLTGGDREPPPHGLKKFWNDKGPLQEGDDGCQQAAP
ncbi:hypothetical protein IscW_ISCW001327 [Ixodes scapularis]|uniref:Uncharacterized protein n=1 Tax=Ixodes scapularis TaxID=6945 RepID=B7P754_IXOSC|nr:hypothetical protein IscW_ISCW001327 [Ixodes scapularis]|eukprot:XP_002409574.1 hypothetical protein IscW_ISCW001327 [Ixodes scapularis]